MVDVLKESGAFFYSSPDTLDQAVDPLIRPICEKINASGWVWTAESCQGHPDACEACAWASNTAPMLRLVTLEKDLGQMMAALCRAFPMVEDCVMKSNLKPGAMSTPGGFGVFEIHGFRAYPSSRPNPGWTETLIYIDAANVYQRNQALDVFRAFADLVSEHGHTNHEKGES